MDSVGGLLGAEIGMVPIVGSWAELAGLRLTAERMAGRRRRVATVLVHRVGPDAEPVPDPAEPGVDDDGQSPGPAGADQDAEDRT